MRRTLLLLATLVPLWSGPGTGEPRVVWAGPGVTLLGGPSRDGRYLSFVDPATGNLAVRNLTSGAVRQLTNKSPGAKEFAYFSSISPDSKSVAYAWFNDVGFYELRVVGLDGSNPRTLYSNEEAGFVQPCAWSPDGKQILTLFFRKDNISQISLVPAAGGPPKLLRSLNWVYPKRMDLSPDGRYIVYDSFANSQSGDRSIFLLAVDGARETKLVDVPGNHLFPLWAPGGRSVVFASDRSGTMDLWTLNVRDGRTDGAPALLRRAVGRILPLGVTGEGDYYFGVRSGESDVFITDIDRIGANARRATTRFPGRNSAPAWSQNGKLVAYLSRRGSENFGQESRAIVIRPLESGAERELLPKLAHIERLRWSPDDASLLVSGSDNKGRAGLYIVDATSAAVRPVIAEPGAGFRGFEGVWTRDGKAVAYIREHAEIRLRRLDSGRETTVHRGTDLRDITISPDGRLVAVSEGGSSITIIPVAGGEKRTIAFAGLTELEWGADLIAARGAGLWRVPLDSGTATKIDTPGNREPGFSPHPDGKRIAVTAGNVQSEVRVMRIAGP